LVRRARRRPARRSRRDRDGSRRADHPRLRQLRLSDADPRRRAAQPDPRARRRPDGSGRRRDLDLRRRAALPPPSDRRAPGRTRAVKTSPDRVLYLARVLARKLKANLNLGQRADDETVRRAIVRDLTEAYRELDAMEERVRGTLAKR